QVHHAVAEAPLVQQLEVQPDAGGNGGGAAPDDRQHEEEAALVYEAIAEGEDGELGAADAEVTVRARLHLAHGVGGKLALDARAGGRGRLERAGVDDLLGRAPDLRVLLLVWRIAGHRLGSLPERHDLVEPPPVQVRADGALEVVDEGVYLRVGLGEGKVPLLV